MHLYLARVHMAGAFQDIWNLRCKVLKKGKIILLNERKPEMKCTVRTTLWIIKVSVILYTDILYLGESS